MKKRKKLIIVSIIVLIILLVGLIISNKEYNKYGLFEIKYNEVIEKINNKETFILVISKTTCTYCAEYKPVLKSVAKEYKIKAYYIDVDLLTDEEKKEFSKYISYSSTPETIFINNGEENSRANRLSGSVSEDKIIKKLKLMGYID